MGKTILAFMLIFSAVTGCSPFNDEKGALNYSDGSNRPIVVKNTDEVFALRKKIKLLKEKEREWKKIVADARESYMEIQPIMKKKCYACHDSDTPLPWYGRPFRRNIIREHYYDGIAHLDFSAKFPLQAKGDPPQISLLKAVKNAVLDRTMPLKIYTTLLPLRRIFKKDEEKILAWIDPLIEEVEEFDRKYKELGDDSPRGLAKELFELKCFRCHANGNAQGDFGGMEDLAKTAKGEYVNLESPEDSLIYTEVLNGDMPPSERERLTQEELDVVLDWIVEESKNAD